MRVFALIALLSAGATGLGVPKGDPAPPTATNGPVVYNQRKWPLLNPDQALSSLVAKARATPSAVSLLSDVPVPAGVSQALASAKLAAPAASAEELEAARRPVEAFAQAATSTCTNPEIHREWRTLTSAQKGAYVNAMKCLFGQPSRSGLAGTRNRWDDLVAIHQLMSNIIHEVGQFLPWHRYFLKILETEMRNTCGYTGPMSWWDETKDAGDFHNSPVANPNYFGYLVPASDHCLKTGVFKNTQCHIGPGTSNTVHCLSRGVSESLSSAITTSFVNTCASYNDYEDMQNCWFYGPHAYGHDAMGGDMSDINSSPNDPLFFLHHGFVDRNWRNWQLADPGNRTYAIGGYTTQNCGNSCQPTTLSYQLASLGFDAAVTIQQVMDTLNPYLCYKYDY